MAAIEDWFHRRYERVYGYADRAAKVRLLEARVQIVGVTQKPDFESLRPFATAADPAIGRRTIHEHGQAVEAVVYQRAALKPGDSFVGPAVVEQYDTTVYVPAGFRVGVDRWFNLIGERLA